MVMVVIVWNVNVLKNMKTVSNLAHFIVYSRCEVHIFVGQHFFTVDYIYNLTFSTLQ